MAFTYAYWPLVKIKGHIVNKTLVHPTSTIQNHWQCQKYFSPVYHWKSSRFQSKSTISFVESKWRQQFHFQHDSATKSRQLTLSELDDDDNNYYCSLNAKSLYKTSTNLFSNVAWWEINFVYVENNHSVRFSRRFRTICRKHHIATTSLTRDIAVQSLGTFPTLFVCYCCVYFSVSELESCANRWQV